RVQLFTRFGCNACEHRVSLQLRYAGAQVIHSKNDVVDIDGGPVRKLGTLAVPAPIQHINFWHEEEAQAKAQHPEVEAAQKDEVRKRGKQEFFTTDPKFDERFQLGYNMKSNQRERAEREREKRVLMGALAREEIGPGGAHAHVAGTQPHHPDGHAVCGGRLPGDSPRWVYVWSGVAVVLYVSGSTSVLLLSLAPQQLAAEGPGTITLISSVPAPHVACMQLACTVHGVLAGQPGLHGRQAGPAHPQQLTPGAAVRPWLRRPEPPIAHGRRQTWPAYAELRLQQQLLKRNLQGNERGKLC
ncbi:Cir_N domain-containing protein, partial [Haematococcus lacustris]